MPTPKLTGSGISFGDPIENQYGDQTADTALQNQQSAIVKIAFTSCTTQNQSASGDGSDNYIAGSQIDMGVPQKSTNWYRITYNTVVDDNDGSISGFGVDCYRYTPSGGWERVLATGSHWSYDNNMGDWYRSPNVIFWVPVHPTYPTQGHQFKLHARTHDSGNVRWNCDIGSWASSGSHKNNTLEIWEVDGDFVTSSNLTRY